MVRVGLQVLLEFLAVLEVLSVLSEHLDRDGTLLQSRKDGQRPYLLPLDLVSFPLLEEEWVDGDLPVPILRVLAGEEAVAGLEESVDRFLCTQRNDEWIDLVLIHEHLDVFFIFFLVDEAAPKIERSKLAALLEFSIEDFLVHTRTSSSRWEAIELLESGFVEHSAELIR